MQTCRRPAAPACKPAHVGCGINGIKAPPGKHAPEHDGAHRARTRQQASRRSPPHVAAHDPHGRENGCKRHDAWHESCREVSFEVDCRVAGGKDVGADRHDPIGAAVKAASGGCSCIKELLRGNLHERRFEVALYRDRYGVIALVEIQFKRRV